MIFACFALRNSAPSSASAAEAATNFKMVHSTCIAPLILMGFPSRGREPRKNIPAALLFASAALRYDASEWTFNTMSDG